MKTKLALFIACLCICFSVPAYAADTSITVNGLKWETELPLSNNNGVTMISIYDAAPLIGGKTKYREGMTYISFGVGSLRFYKNDTTVTVNPTDYVKDTYTIELDSAPMIIDGMLMLPMRDFLKKCNNTDIVWNGETNNIEITMPINENVVSITDFAKIKDKPVKEVVVLYDTNKPAVTLTQPQNINSAMNVAKTLSFYKTPTALRCQPVTVEYTIKYADGEVAQIIFKALKDIDSMLEPIVKYNEAVEQTQTVK